MKTAIVVGHKSNKQGSINEESGVSEFVFNSILASKLKLLIPDSVVIFRNYYSELPRRINSYNPDFIISLHCNAFNTKVSGTETLYCAGSKKGKLAAEIFQRHIVKALELNDRGIKAKERRNRGGLVLYKTKAPCLILEPFFIDNNNDLNQAGLKSFELAASIAAATKEVKNALGFTC